MSKNVNMLKQKIDEIIEEMINLKKGDGKGEQWNSPFISKKVYDREENRWYSKIRKFILVKKDIFNKKYQELKGSVDILGKGYFQKKELDEDDFLYLVEGLFLKEEFEALFYDLFFVTSETFFEEISKHIDDFIVSIDVKPKNPSQEFADKTKKYYELLSKRFIDKINGDLQDVIIFGFTQGKSNENIRRAIVKYFDNFSTKRAYGIARTETNRLANGIQKDYYKQVGVKKYNLLPAIDACSRCKSKADRNPYNIDDLSGMPPIHPNCRCTITPVI